MRNDSGSCAASDGSIARIPFTISSVEVLPDFRIVISDPGNPNASAAGAWVGLEQQPQTIKGFYDFQKWLKAYQFWVQADEDGNFAVPNVIAGANYTLWAYGPGAAGTMGLAISGMAFKMLRFPMETVAG